MFFLSSNGRKWVQIKVPGRRLPSNIYSCANKATEGCKVLKKRVAGVNLADPARFSTGRSSFISAYLTTIGVPWYFGRVLVPQRLINQSLYHKILPLQKFNYPLGKVLKPKKIQPPTSEKKNEAVFYFLIFSNWDFDLEISHLRKKVFILTSKM